MDYNRLAKLNAIESLAGNARAWAIAPAKFNLTAPKPLHPTSFGARLSAFCNRSGQSTDARLESLERDRRQHLLFAWHEKSNLRHLPVFESGL